VKGEIGLGFLCGDKFGECFDPQTLFLFPCFVFVKEQCLG